MWYLQGGAWFAGGTTEKMKPTIRYVGHGRLEQHIESSFFVFPIGCAPLSRFGGYQSLNKVYKRKNEISFDIDLTITARKK